MGAHTKTDPKVDLVWVRKYRNAALVSEVVRIGRAVRSGRDEAESDPVSDEGRRPRLRPRSTRLNLNFSNRPVRTRMPGGVGRERTKVLPPIPINWTVTGLAEGQK